MRRWGRCRGRCRREALPSFAGSVGRKGRDLGRGRGRHGPPARVPFGSVLYSIAVPDLPFHIADDQLRARLEAAVDREAKIPRALDALGPVADRDVVLLEAAGGLRAGQLEELGARVQALRDATLGPLADSSADIVAGLWGPFPGDEPQTEQQVSEAERILRPGGKLLVVHDYGRDDLSRLMADEERERRLVDWSRRDGWFLRRQFKVRVLHCWWTFDSIEDARELLAAAFGSPGDAVGAELKRPRIAHKVAVYHRTPVPVPEG